MAEQSPSTEIPAFTQTTRGEASENREDSDKILSDQDLTESGPQTGNENMGNHNFAADTIENEPEDFAQGEVDVKTQMDRAARAMDAAVRGHRGPQQDGPSKI